MGAVFLLAALAVTIVIVVAGTSPGASPICGVDGCEWRNRPVDLLDDDIASQVIATPEHRRAFEAFVRRPDVRFELAAVEVFNRGPLALLLLGVGVALRRLAGDAPNALGQALRWLRLASLAAIAWALTSPIHESLRATVLSGGTPTGPKLELWIYLDRIGGGLLLGLAAYAAVWAIEAGLAARRDLDNFI
ncbi:hypothetical protein [uncultured Caulobacter sp.]|uniref:hypothetical protein n=1 Tax=uncultured Caulobacter sp. TaxID=158749 RepID=UPI00260C0E1B|nr:hypothetical protein [uncultured Caulobacter sp.]